MADIDWDQLQKEAGDVLLPDGDYNVVVLSDPPPLATQASTGKPMIKLQAAILDGPKKDRKIFTQLTLTVDNPFALKMWFNQMAAFGLGPDFFAGKPSMEQVAAALKGRPAVFTVSRREWQGTDRNSVDAIKAYAASGPQVPGLVVGPVSGPSAMTSPAPAPAAAPASAPTSAPTGSLPPPPKPF